MPSSASVAEDDVLVVNGKAELDAYSGSMRVTADELYDFASARAAFAKCLEISCSIEGQVRVPQLASLVPVKPFAYLEVAPEDFPFLKDIRGIDDARLPEYGQAMQTGAPWPE